VWINMLAYDERDAAQRAAVKMDRDPRLRQFYDPGRRAGTAIARGLGADEPAVAWDAYLLYAPGATWENAPPVPFDWAHQLTASRWADRRRYYQGDDLMAALRAIMGRLRGGGDAAN
jgi:hypothetical protein